MKAVAMTASLRPALFYRVPRAAHAFLEAAFGFELVLLIEDADGAVGHSQMQLGDAVIMVGGEWSDAHQSPLSTGGRNTQTLHIDIAGEVDAACARARAAGAVILAEPEDQFYGARTFRCADPEGHIWTVSQAVREVSREEAEAATGLKITGWP